MSTSKKNSLELLAKAAQAAAAQSSLETSKEFIEPNINSIQPIENEIEKLETQIKEEKKQDQVIDFDPVQTTSKEKFSILTSRLEDYVEDYTKHTSSPVVNDLHEILKDLAYFSKSDYKRVLNSIIKEWLDNNPEVIKQLKKKKLKK